MMRLLFEEDQSLPQYIIDTFQMFRFHKKSISLNLFYINKRGFPSPLQDLIMEKVSRDGQDDKEFAEYKDNTNLLKYSLVDSFPNLSEIVLDCTDYDGGNSYQFSLFGICDILMKMKRNKAKVSLYGVCKGEEYNNDRRSWLFDVYSKISSDLKEKYTTIQMSIREVKNSEGHRTDLLVLEVL